MRLRGGKHLPLLGGGGAGPHTPLAGPHHRIRPLCGAVPSSVGKYQLEVPSPLGNKGSLFQPCRVCSVCTRQPGSTYGRKTHWAGLVGPGVTSRALGSVPFLLAPPPLCPSELGGALRDGGGGAVLRCRHYFWSCFDPDCLARGL